MSRITRTEEASIKFRASVLGLRIFNDKITQVWGGEAGREEEKGVGERGVSVCTYSCTRVQMHTHGKCVQSTGQACESGDRLLVLVVATLPSPETWPL